MTPPNTAERILAVAHELMDREGAEAVSMRRIAQQVGVTPMAIYRHFPNRETLLRKVSDHAFQLIAADWAARCGRHTDALQRLMALREGYLDYALEHPHLFDYAFSVPREDARQYPDDFRARRSPTFNIAVDAVAEAMRQGVLREDDPYAVVMTLTGLQHGLITLYRGGRFGYDATRFRTFYLDSMERMINGLKA